MSEKIARTVSEVKQEVISGLSKGLGDSLRPETIKWLAEAIEILTRAEMNEYQLQIFQQNNSGTTGQEQQQSELNGS